MYRPKALPSTMPHTASLVVSLFTVLGNKSKRDVAAVNRTRGSCMASTNFTTKPLRRTYKHRSAKMQYTLVETIAASATIEPCNNTHVEPSPFKDHNLYNSVLSAFPTLHQQNAFPTPAMETLDLPNLEGRTLARFDELARKEKIFYEEAVSELITVDGFDVSRLFNFLISITLMRVLIKKQILHATFKSLHWTGKMTDTNIEQSKSR
jgi:hypothetical protein